MFHKTILESVGISELRLRRLAHVVNSLDVDNRQGHPQQGSHFICCAVVKYPDEGSLGTEGVIVHRGVDVRTGLGTAESEWKAETLMLNSPPPLL